MAMINCPECKQEVSNKANKCPNCGFQLNKPTRGFFGFIFKWLFILFNIAMILSLVSGLVGVGEATESINKMSDAEAAGTAIGAGIGISMLIGVWIAGDIILGLFVLFTRPKN